MPIILIDADVHDEPVFPVPKSVVFRKTKRKSIVFFFLIVCGTHSANGPLLSVVAVIHNLRPHK